VRRLFRSFSGRNGQPRPNDFYIKSIISHAEFKRELMKMSAQVSSADAEALCLAIDKQNNGIDYLEWLETLDPTSTDRFPPLCFATEYLFSPFCAGNHLFSTAVTPCFCWQSSCPKTSSCQASALKSSKK
jgi:hypothetical protein